MSFSITLLYKRRYNKLFVTYIQKLKNDKKKTTQPNGFLKTFKDLQNRFINFPHFLKYFLCFRISFRHRFSSICLILMISHFKRRKLGVFKSLDL